jgi:hypothetical protein
VEYFSKFCVLQCHASLSFAFENFESMGYLFIHHHIYIFFGSCFFGMASFISLPFSLAHASLAWHLLFLSYFCIAQTFFLEEFRERGS